MAHVFFCRRQMNSLIMGFMELVCLLHMYIYIYIGMKSYVHRYLSTKVVGSADEC